MVERALDLPALLGPAHELVHVHVPEPAHEHEPGRVREREHGLVPAVVLLVKMQLQRPLLSQLRPGLAPELALAPGESVRPPH